MPLCLGVVALVVCTARDARAETWTERDVVDRAMKQAPGALVARAQAALAHAHVEAAPRHPDPSVAFERAQLFGPGDPYEMSFIVGVPIDLSGRRAVERHLASAGAAAADADLALARAEVATAALLAFVDVIGARRVLALEKKALDAAATATRVLASREESGSVAGYDRLRLELEAELHRSAVAQARAAVAAQEEVLRAMVAPDLAALPELDGTLDIGAPEPLDVWKRRAREHEALAHVRRGAAASTDAIGAARSAWVPTIDLHGGAKTEGDDAGSDWGYVAGVSLSLPLFGRDEGLPAVARAEEAGVRAAREALERRILSEVIVAHGRLVAVHAELERFVQATSPHVDELLRAARTGYQEGIREVMELLDAERAAMSVRQRALELVLEAKRADVTLRGAAGALGGAVGAPAGHP